jgi:hypothetical protein
MRRLEMDIRLLETEEFEDRVDITDEEGEEDRGVEISELAVLKE